MLAQKDQDGPLPAPPLDAEALYQAAIARYHERKIDEAIALLEAVIRLAPASAAPYCMLGSSHMIRHRYAEAVEAARRAIELGLANALGFGLLGEALHHLGQHAEAVDNLQKALAEVPEAARMWMQCGHSQRLLKDYPAAARSLATALALKPESAETHHQLGELAFDENRHEDAVRSFQTAVAIDPNQILSYSRLGQSQVILGRPDDAVATSARALAVTPRDMSAQYNIGNALYRHARPAEAIRCFERALALDPDHTMSRFNKATAHLMAGEFAAGWVLHEARYELVHVTPTTLAPQWSGEKLDGRTILVQLEQGLGDILQFCRYLPLLRARGARVLLEVSPIYASLRRLLEQSLTDVTIVSDTGEAGVFDFHCPLMSLPLAFGTTLDTIPGAAPYLKADPDEAAIWAARLRACRGLKVGLVWAGGDHSHHAAWADANRRRNIDISRFAPLAAVAGVHLVSLQKRPRDEAAAPTPAPGFDLIDVAGEISDMASTAAIVANLDLVVSVDTSVAHLAGALARPVWILSRFDGDWRWLLDRDDSPWYPTARLFRQSATFDWTPVIGRMAEALSAEVARRV